MILVFPDGRIDGANAPDSEWANTPAGAFESYVVDVVHSRGLWSPRTDQMLIMAGHDFEHPLVGHEDRRVA